jgi:hypothetical protein
MIHTHPFSLNLQNDFHFSCFSPVSLFREDVFLPEEAGKTIVHLFKDCTRQM